ncbi:STAS domain-containing protein [Treponema sp.]|uniref:STAS domain-containing protein n=1 Tax=Treponema sp. TaxID=166 RepID=UPI003EFC75C1
MDQLALKEKIGVNYMLLELTGSLNSYTISELQTKLFTYIVDANVVLDASQVVQVDSSGLGLILAGHNDAEASGTKLFVMNPSSAIKQALERTGFFDMFHIIHSVTEVSDD